MSSTTSPSTRTSAHKPWYKVLYIQVLIAIAIGIVLGHYFPKTGIAMKPLGDAFIALIRMMIAPVIFCTVVHGIGSMSDLTKVGRVGVKTLLYFEAVTTVGLVGQEGKVLRSTFGHSILLAALLGSIALVQSYWLTSMIP